MRDLQHRSQSLIFNCTDEEGGVTCSTGSYSSQTNVPESANKNGKRMERSTTQIPCPYFLIVQMKMLDLNCTDEEGGVTYTTGSHPFQTNISESSDKQWKRMEISTTQIPCP